MSYVVRFVTRRPRLEVFGMLFEPQNALESLEGGYVDVHQYVTLISAVVDPGCPRRFVEVGIEFHNQIDPIETLQLADTNFGSPQDPGVADYDAGLDADQRGTRLPQSPRN